LLKTNLAFWVFRGIGVSSFGFRNLFTTKKFICKYINETLY
jgi:hypothetical protein